MAKAAAVLGVFMLDEKGGSVRAGTRTREVEHTVRKALETWSKIAPGLLGSDSSDRILRRLDTLTLVHEVRLRIGL